MEFISQLRRYKSCNQSQPLPTSAWLVLGYLITNLFVSVGNGLMIRLVESTSGGWSVLDLLARAHQRKSISRPNLD